MQRYREYFKRMLEEEKEKFETFQLIHDNYTLDQNKWQYEYNIEGAKILEIVREYENRLCANQERGMYNRYSAALAEKFQNEIRKKFPMYDYIGVKISGKTTSPQSRENININQDFTLKKIELA